MIGRTIYVLREGYESHLERLDARKDDYETLKFQKMDDIHAKQDLKLMNQPRFTPLKSPLMEEVFDMKVKNRTLHL